MAYINQPADLRVMFENIEQRLRKLETAQRFTAPDVAVVPTYPRTGDIVYDNSNYQMTYWNGTEWVVFGDDNLGVPKVPFTSTWAGTGLTYTGSPSTAYYCRVGKMIFCNIFINCATVTNFGTGDYTLTLPTGLTPSVHSLWTGGLHHTSSGDHYLLYADVEPSLTVKLYYPQANGTMARMDYNSPHTLQTTDYFYFSGFYLLA